MFQNVNVLHFNDSLWVLKYILYNDYSDSRISYGDPQHPYFCSLLGKFQVGDIGHLSL
jgi:hypothetical protein